MQTSGLSEVSCEQTYYEVLSTKHLPLTDGQDAIGVYNKLLEFYFRKPGNATKSLGVHTGRCMSWSYRGCRIVGSETVNVKLQSSWLSYTNDWEKMLDFL